MKKPIVIGIIAAIAIFASGMNYAFAEESLIPEWVKNTANWWSYGQIEESEFLNAIQFLIKEQIIVIPEPSGSVVLLKSNLNNNGDSVPAWIKEIAQWWSEDQLDDQTFVNGIQFLIQNNIIKVSQSDESQEISIFTIDIQENFFSIRGDTLEAFVELEAEDKLEITQTIIQYDRYCPDCKPKIETIFEIQELTKGTKILPRLPFGDYDLKFNDYKEQITISENGHNSQILKTVRDDGKVLCLGTFLSIEECLYHKSVKHQPAQYKIVYHQESWEKRLGVDAYASCVINEIAYLKFFDETANRYVSIGNSEVSDLANQWINGEMSYSEYMEQGTKILNHYNNLAVQEIQNYYDSLC